MTNAAVPISRPLRFWLGVEVCFGVAASLSIGLSPEDTSTNFAWPVRPAVMAAVLGAFYITTAPLFMLPLFARRWENVRVIILPAALFTLLELIATLLHWDKFSVGSRPFWVWFASYILPPPILVAAWIWHQRQPGANRAPTAPFSRGLRRTCVLCGGTLTLLGATGFIAPTLFIPHAAWTMTPLTTRALAGWLIVYGTLLLSMARENDRTRCRLVSLMTVLALPILLLQMLRFQSQVDWSRPSLWVGLALFAVVMACGVNLARGSWREALR